VKVKKTPSKSQHPDAEKAKTLLGFHSHRFVFRWNWYYWGRAFASTSVGGNYSLHQHL